MKKTRKRIFGILMTALMICLPAMQALAQTYDVSVMDPAPILFPGDELTGIVTPVMLDGAPLDLGVEVPAVWTNQDENKVYSAALAEDGSGSILLALAGYELDVEGGASEAGDETTGPIGGHYKMTPEEEAQVDPAAPKTDRAYYPAYTVVKLKAEEPKEGMVFDKWAVESLSGAVTVEDETNSETTVTMPEEKVKITANYRAADAEVPADPNAEGAPVEGEIDPNMGVTPEGQDGVDAGLAPEEQQIPGGDVVPEVPDGTDPGVAPDGAIVVDGVETTPEVTVDSNAGGASDGSILSGVDENAIDIMIGDDYTELGTVDPTASNAPESVPAPEEINETKYMLSVNYGTVTVENAEGADASQGFIAGTPITVTANDYTANGCYFNGWVAGPGELALENNMEQTVTFPMPEGELVLTAQYIDANGIAVADPTVPIVSADPEGSQDGSQQPEEQQDSQIDEQGGEVVTPPSYNDEGESATQYNVSVTDGTITKIGEVEQNPSTETASVSAETSVTVKANTVEGKTFKEWTVAGPSGFALTNSNSSEVTFEMPAGNVTLTATYTELPTPTNYTVKTTNGSIDGDGAEKTVTSGLTVTITANPAPAGQVFSEWIVKEGTYDLGASKTSQTVQVTVTGNLTFEATYKPIEYTVAVNSGSASVAKAAAGTTVTITAAAAPKGMEFDYWTVNSGNAALANAYSATTTFPMPAANVTVTANYKMKEYYVTVENGSADSDAYYKGDEVTVSSNYPSSGREFDKWVVIDGKASFADASRWTTTFTMPAKDVTVSATYKDGPSPESNQILDITEGGEYITDSTIRFTAAGAGMDNTNPNPGDYRYRPIGYQIGNVTGSWQESPYTTSMSIKARGDYTLKVNYNKEVFDGANWVADGTTDTRSVSFRVLTPAEAVKTGDNTPIALMVTLAGASCLMFLALLAMVVRRRRNG